MLPAPTSLHQEGVIWVHFGQKCFFLTTGIIHIMLTAPFRKHINSFTVQSELIFAVYLPADAQQDARNSPK